MLQCWIQMPNECRDGNEMCRCICGHNPFTVLMHKEGCRSLLPPCLSEICSQTAFLVMEDKHLLKDETWRKWLPKRREKMPNPALRKVMKRWIQHWHVKTMKKILNKSNVFCCFFFTLAFFINFYISKVIFYWSL